MNSSVLRWPDREQVDRAARDWAAREAPRHPGVLRIGYCGSYARGDWGVGSDLDLIAVVNACDEPWISRAAAWELESLPVPAELRVYTSEEWQALLGRGDRQARTLAAETVWILEAAPPDAPRER